MTVPDPLSPREARKPLTGAFDFFVRGWRPACGWACGIVTLVRGAVVPVVEVARGEAVAPLDWVAFSALAVALGLGWLRTTEKRDGTTV